MTPEEIKNAVVQEVACIYAMDPDAEGMCAGFKPEREWQLKLKEGFSFKCYEDKPVDSAQWIFLYRLLGLAERDATVKAGKLAQFIEDLISQDPHYLEEGEGVYFVDKSEAKALLREFRGEKVTV